MGCQTIWIAAVSQVSLNLGSASKKEDSAFYMLMGLRGDISEMDLSTVLLTVGGAPLVAASVSAFLFQYQNAVCQEVIDAAISL